MKIIMTVVVLVFLLMVYVTIKEYFDDGKE